MAEIACSSMLEQQNLVITKFGATDVNFYVVDKNRTFVKIVRKCFNKEIFDKSGLKLCVNIKMKQRIIGQILAIGLQVPLHMLLHNGYAKK